MPHHLCVCKYHATFAFMIEPICKIIPAFPPKIDEFLKKVCCDVENERCMSSRCKNCVYDIEEALIPLKFLDRTSHTIAWKHWHTIQKQTVLGTPEFELFVLFREINLKLPGFKLHYFIKLAKKQI